MSYDPGGNPEVLDRSTKRVQLQNVQLPNVQLPNDQLPNVHLPNVHLPNVQLQIVQVKKCPGYKTSKLPNVHLTKRPGYSMSSLQNVQLGRIRLRKPRISSGENLFCHFRAEIYKKGFLKQVLKFTKIKRFVFWKFVSWTFVSWTIVSWTFVSWTFCILDVLQLGVW
jgi:hypothetical protein